MRTNAKVYVVRAEDGTLKLGHSKDPINRAKDIRPKVEIVHQTDVLDQAEKIERLAHRVLALHGTHLRGEWFEASLDEAIAAIDIAIRQAEGSELPLGGKLKQRERPPSPFVSTFTMRADPDFLDDLDELRLSERPQLSRSDMLRKLVHDGKRKLASRHKKADVSP